MPVRRQQRPQSSDIVTAHHTRQREICAQLQHPHAKHTGCGTKQVMKSNQINLSFLKMRKSTTCSGLRVIVSLATSMYCFPSVPNSSSPPPLQFFTRSTNPHFMHCLKNGKHHLCSGCIQKGLDEYSPVGIQLPGRKQV